MSPPFISAASEADAQLVSPKIVAFPFPETSLASKR
jgi:hypothetical protein